MMTLRVFLLALLALSMPSHADEILKPVKLITVQSSDTSITRQFFGQVVAKQTVDLAFQVAGQIVTFPVVEGEPVEKGKLIAELDLKPYELVVKRTKVELQQAERKAARFKKLSNKAVTKSQVEETETNLALARLAVDTAENDLKHATLVAPFNALVATRSVANFSTVAAGSSIVRLHDMSELRIEIDVPEVLFQKAGSQPDVEIEAKFPTNDQTFPVNVIEFNAETSTVGQAFKLTLGMSPQAGLNIFPGSSVTITAKLKGAVNGVQLPASAVVIDADGSTFAMKFIKGEGETGTVSKVSIKTESTANGTVRVLSGLERDDVVVAAGAAQLEDGQAVRVFKGFSN